jgi:RHS repeat-associated protein
MKTNKSSRNRSLRALPLVLASSLLAAAATLAPLAVQADPGPVPPGGALTTGYGYDAEGNLTTVNLPKGTGQTAARQETHTYDGLGRRTRTTLARPAPGASSPTLGYGYDGLDQVQSVTTPLTSTTNLTTTYTTTGLGNTTTQVSPDTRTTNATYYDDGLLKTRTDARNQLFSYEYDDLGRLTKISYSAGTASQFEYDGGPTPPNQNSVGQLSKLTDEAGTTSWTHDGLGRVLSKTQVVATTPSRSFTLSQTWGDSGSGLGKLKSQTYPSLAQVNYSYDAAGRLQRITFNPVKANGSGTNLNQTLAVVRDIGYTALGAVSGWTWNNGDVPHSRGYDGEGRLQSYPLGNPAGSGKAEGLIRTITYDDAGRIAGFTHANINGPVAAYDQSYIHDGLDRIEQQAQQASSFGYGYDLNGNRKTQTVAGTTYSNTMEAGSNRIKTERQPQGNTTFTYDQSGNLSGDGSSTYTHGARGRLSSITTGADTVSYLYNGLEQRLAKSGPTSKVPGGRRYFVYDEQGHLIGEYDQDGNPVYEVIWFNDTPVAVLTQTRTGSGETLSIATKVFYVYADHLDTPRVIVRAADHFVQWRWDQAEAYGNSPPNENPTNLATPLTFNLRFPGQIYDQESGLVYNHHRYYDASTGRYVESDPIGLEGGLNTYRYANANPFLYIDADGLATLPKNFGKDKPLPLDPQKHLPEKVEKDTERRQGHGEDFEDFMQCRFNPFRNCEAQDHLKKATRCILTFCTTCDGKTFYTGITAKETSAFDPATTKCKCVEYGLDPNYVGGAPPGLTPAGR